MISSRSSMLVALAAVSLLVGSAPAAAQSSAGALAIRGMTSRALWADAGMSAGQLSVTSSLPSRRPAPVRPGTSYLTGAQVDSPVPVSALAGSDVAARQEEASGGFPWLEVGIGAVVGALFLQAVATANSGDSAELPAGGISVVLPSS